METMESKKCPNCNLINPETAQKCDCGYNFVSGKMDVSEVLKSAVFESFQKAETFTEQSISDRSIVGTGHKLILGAFVIDVATILGAIMGEKLLQQPGAAKAISALGCALGIWIVNAIIFANVDLLDKLRWKRFWVGAIIGYWLAYIPLVYSGVPVDPISAFGLACISGLLVGFLGVYITDHDDKTKALMYFREWQETKSGVKHKVQNRPHANTETTYVDRSSRVERRADLSERKKTDGDATVTGMVRYCVVCGKEWGPFFSRFVVPQIVWSQ